MIDDNISDRDFEDIRNMLYDIAGITISKQKKTLVFARLSKRILHYGLQSFSEYLCLIKDSNNVVERKLAIDLLTTNETSFYREPKHFSYLQGVLKHRASTYRPFRVWSAACSSGQEPYSIAMLLDSDTHRHQWEIIASDISDQILTIARKGQYRIEEAEKIPQAYLKKYCLKGVGSKSGTFILDKSLRNLLKFAHINLNKPLPGLGEFDIVFLRNVMIYFEMDKKREIVSNVIETIKPGGYLFVGHSESLNGVTNKLRLVAPAIYQKPHS